MRRSAEVETEDRDVVVPPEDLIIAAAGYGRWQLGTSAILCLTILTHVMNSSLDPIHHMAGWWCEKPETLRRWTTPQWIMFSHVNLTRRGFTERLITDKFKGCYVYGYNFSDLVDTAYAQRPDIGNRRATRCARVHYSQKFGKSVAERFNIGCHSKSEHFLWHFLPILGQVLGYLIFGCLSDRVGRKPVLFAACGITPLTSLALAFAPNYIVYIIVRTLHSFFHSGFLVSVILMLEMTSNAWRSRVAAIAALLYAVAVGVTPLLFQALTSVDQLTILVNIPCAMVVFCMSCVSESPAWLFCTRDTERLNEVIRNAASVNGVPLPGDFRVRYVEHTDADKILPHKRPGFWSLLQDPEVACEMAGIGYLMALSGLINGSALAKLIYNEKRIGSWYSIIGLDKMAGVILGQFCVLMMGHRKVLHIAVFLLLVTTGALMLNLREDYVTTTGPATTILAANLFAVSLTYGAMLNYSVRTVPTLVRGAYLGMWNSLWIGFTWLGTHRYLNYPGMSSVAVITILIGGLATLNFRDLLRRELPDTVNDAVNFKAKPKPKRWALSDMQMMGGTRANTLI